MSGADFFDQATRAAEALHALALKVAEEKRQHRNERRRRRYVIAKQFGGAKQKANPVPEPEYEYEPPKRCTCQEPPYAPPCSWCERQEDPEGEVDRG